MKELCKYSFTIGATEMFWVINNKLTLNQSKSYLEAVTEINYQADIDLLAYIYITYGLK